MIPYRVEPIHTILAELQAPAKPEAGVSFEQHLQSSPPPSSANDQPQRVEMYEDPPVSRIEPAADSANEPEEPIDETAQDDARDGAGEDSSGGEGQAVEAPDSTPEETVAAAAAPVVEEPAAVLQPVEIDAEEIELQDPKTAKESDNKTAPAKTASTQRPSRDEATQPQQLQEKEAATATNVSSDVDQNDVEIETPTLPKKTGEKQPANQRGGDAEEKGENKVVKQGERKPEPTAPVNTTSDAKPPQQEEEKPARRSGNRFASSNEASDSSKANRPTAARRAAAAAADVAAVSDADRTEAAPASSDQTTTTTSSETAPRVAASNAIGGFQSRLSATSGPHAHQTNHATKPLTEPQQARLVQRVARAFEVAHHRGESTIRLRLSPPELGSLRLEIKLEGGAMTAHIEAETATARDVLMDNLQTLRQRLAEQNIKVENFDVSLQDRQTGGQTEHNGGHRWGQQSSRQQNESSADRRNVEQVVGDDASQATSSDNAALDVTI